MKAGRELDILVAENVMHEKVIETYECNGEDNFWLDSRDLFGDQNHLPNFSTEIQDAWSVVEEIDLFKTYELHQDKNGKWQIGFGSDSAYFDAETEGDSAPHAICLAALKVVGYKVEG